MNQTALTFMPVGVTAIVYSTTSLDVESSNIGGTQVQITQISVQSETTVNVVSPGTTVIQSAVTGPRGLVGQTGDKGDSITGPKGTTGNTGDKGDTGNIGTQYLQYLFTQMLPETVWSIQHNLNLFPEVKVIDSAGSLVSGDVTYDSSNHITVSFSAAFAGTAYLG